MIAVHQLPAHAYPAQSPISRYNSAVLSAGAVPAAVAVSAAGAAAPAGPVTALAATPVTAAPPQLLLGFSAHQHSSGCASPPALPHGAAVIAPVSARRGPPKCSLPAVAAAVAAAAAAGAAGSTHSTHTTSSVRSGGCGAAVATANHHQPPASHEVTEEDESEAALNLLSMAAGDPLQNRGGAGTASMAAQLSDNPAEVDSVSCRICAAEDEPWGNGHGLRRSGLCGRAGSV